MKLNCKFRLDAALISASMSFFLIQFKIGIRWIAICYQIVVRFAFKSLGINVMFGGCDYKTWP